VTGDWYWQRKPDPCPVKALGITDAGEYVFVTALRLVRRFTTNGLHSTGGPNDLFGGKLDWARRHFRRWDPINNKLTGALNKQQLMGAMIQACDRVGYYDNAVPHRSVGTWRGPDGDPVIHCGDAILYRGEVFEPGETIGDYRYVLGPRREAPSLDWVGNRGFRLKPGPLSDCLKVVARIGSWNWLDPEGRDLFIGGICCDVYGDALHWKPHRFIRAMPGAGKSTLLKYTRYLLGSAAHDVQRNFTRAMLEQRFSNTSCALLLDEMESDTDGEKLRRVFELVRLMSDDGATGGRGTSGGQARSINLHGSVTMVATLAEAWRPQDRSRIAYIELGRLRDREGHEDKSQEEIEREVYAEATEMSAGVRARILDRFPLFRENLALVRARILELGGAPRDADQLGYLIAGWATMTKDEPLASVEVEQLKRFTPYIMTLAEEADGTDDPSECLHTLFGLSSGIFEQGREMTIGQVIAEARDPETGARMRNALGGLGLRLNRLQSEVDGRLEAWSEAWLAVANKHAKLEKLFADYAAYRAPKRAQILSGLKKTVNGVPHVPKRAEKVLRFGGVPSRAWLVPPIFLPTVDDRDDNDRVTDQ